MKKLLLLSIAVMIIGTAKAMDNSVIVSTLVLPPSQGTTIPKGVENSPRSTRTSLDDDSDWSDWSCDNSPRTPIEPQPKTIEECTKYLDKLDEHTQEFYLLLLKRKILQKPVSYAVGLGLYQSGLTYEKSARYGGTIQYFLIDAFKAAIKEHFKEKNIIVGRLRT